MKFTVEVTDEPQDRPVTITIQIGSDEPESADKVVAGAASADLTQAGTFDPLQQADELPDDKRRIGF